MPQDVGHLARRKKNQHGHDITILGVGFGLRHVVIDLAAARRVAPLQEIHEALTTDKLTQGAAGKLKGKIYFTIEHQFGKCGKHLFRLLFERQCKGGSFSTLLCEFVPRPIEDLVGDFNEFAIFVDGWWPEPFRNGEQVNLGNMIALVEGRIGSVIFAKHLPTAGCPRLQLGHAPLSRGDLEGQDQPDPHGGSRCPIGGHENIWTMDDWSTTIRQWSRCW